MCPQHRRKTKCVFRPKKSGTPDDVCLDGRAQLRIRFLLGAPNLIAAQNVTYAPSSLEHIIMRVMTVLVCMDKSGLLLFFGTQALQISSPAGDQHEHEVAWRSDVLLI